MVITPNLMYKKIIYLIEYPFDSRDYDRFGVNIFEGAGFSLEVWDLVKIVRPVSLHKFLDSQNKLLWNKIRTFVSIKELYSAMVELSHDTIFISLLHYSIDSLPVYRILTKLKFRYCVYLATPVRTLSNKKRNSFLKKVSTISFHKLLSKLIMITPYAWLGIKPANYLFAATDNSLTYRKSFPIDSSTEIVWAHVLDYDLYLDICNRNFALEKIAVFIDESVASHPDYTIMGTKPFVSGERYFPAMRRFFDWIESEYKLKVIIAAHPYSKYKERDSLFGERDIVYGKTVEYIAKSSLVLSHSSSVVEMAVLYKKPIACITTNELSQSMQQVLIDEISFELKRKIINVDVGEYEIDFSINEKIYDEYINKKIKKNGTPKLSFCKIVADKIETIY